MRSDGIEYRNPLWDLFEWAKDSCGESLLSIFTLKPFLEISAAKHYNHKTQDVFMTAIALFSGIMMGNVIRGNIL